MKQIRPSQAYIDESRAKALTEKWSPVLDYSSKTVAPIEEDHTRLNTAILLENQESWCLKEANAASTGNSLGTFGAAQGTASQFSSDFYATSDSRLPKILIPMIRRLINDERYAEATTALTRLIGTLRAEGVRASLARARRGLCVDVSLRISSADRTFFVS